MAKEKKAAKCAKDCACKPLTKTQMIQALAEKTSLSKKDVSAVVDQLGELIKSELGKGTKASFTLPGLIKIEKQFVPAKEGQKNVPDPFHPGKTIDRPAKPEHYKIKVKALKALKDMA
ncbi:MAG: HU family DNA-binding protein [Thermoguttaceae bacterium]|nr:HU family DNA-binding protein [Thermoguttaceae bacterium]